MIDRVFGFSTYASNPCNQRWTKIYSTNNIGKIPKINKIPIINTVMNSIMHSTIEDTATLLKCSVSLIFPDEYIPRSLI